MIPPVGRPAPWAGAVLHRSGPLAAGLVAVTGLLAAVLVPFHAWQPWLVLPLLGCCAAGLLWASRLLPVPAEPVWPVLAIVALAAGHGWWAGATHAEHVVLRRDAGSYALFAQWLATHHGLPVDAMLQAFGGSQALADPAFRLASPAFFSVVHGAPGGPGAGAQIVPQFLLGAPSVFSLGMWTGGWQGLLLTPAILSGLAMLALGGLAARLFGSRWAVVAVAVLAVAQPMLHAARSTYSEQAATLLVVAAAGLLVDAVRRRSAALILVSGLMMGLAGLVRVDALREVSLVFPVAAVLALRTPGLAGPLITGALGGTLIAAVPAVLMSRPYLGGIAGSLVPLIGGGIVLGLGSRYVVWHLRSGRGVRFVPGVVRRRPEQAAAALVALAGLVLASRPLWTVTRQNPRDPGSRVVAGLQLRQGLPVDGGRTYAEHSLNWIAWYLGPISILLAWAMFTGLAYMAVRWWRSREPGVPAWLGPAVIGFGSLVLTLYRPGITPDHPWADRRMVPIVLPAFVLAATAALAWAAGRLATGDRRRLARTAYGATAAAGAACLLLPAWLATAPVATASTERGELGAVHQVCAALRPRDAVVAIDNRAANEWPQVIRGVCGRPAASIKAPGPAQYAEPIPAITQRITAAGWRPVLLAATQDGVNAIRELGLTPRPVADLATTEDQHLLVSRAGAEDPLAIQVWLADPAGQVGRARTAG